MEYVGRIINDFKNTYKEFFTQKKDIDDNDISLSKKTINALNKKLNKYDIYETLCSYSFNGGNIRKAFGVPINQCIGILDTSMFKNAKTGILFTDMGIYLKNHFKAGQYISYENLCMSIVSQAEYVEYESSIKRDGYVCEFIAGKNIYNLICELKKDIFNNCDNIRKSVKLYTKGKIESILDDIKNGYSDYARVKAMNLIRAFEDIDIQMKEIVCSAIIIAYMSVGSFVEAMQVISDYSIDWMRNKFDDYTTEYNHYKYNSFIKQGDKYFSGQKYEDAVATYEQAVSYCIYDDEFPLPYKKILDSYYQGASRENLFNYEEYNKYLLFFKEVSEIKEETEKYIQLGDELNKKYNDFTKKLINRMSYIVTSEEKNIINKYPFLLKTSDEFGMNIFLYSILFGKLSMIDLYDKEQLSTIINHKNILGHDYLCVAAISGIDNFMEVLKVFDNTYVKKLKKADRNSTVNYIKEKAFSVTGDIAQTLTDNAMQKIDDFNPDGMNFLIDSLKSKGEQIAENRYNVYDEVEEYLENKYDTVKTILKNSFGKIHINDSTYSILNIYAQAMAIHRVRIGEYDNENELLEFITNRGNGYIKISKQNISNINYDIDFLNAKDKVSVIISDNGCIDIKHDLHIYTTESSFRQMYKVTLQHPFEFLSSIERRDNYAENE